MDLGEFRAYMEDLELTTNFAARVNIFSFLGKHLLKYPKEVCLEQDSATKALGA